MLPYLSSWIGNEIEEPEDLKKKNFFFYNLCTHLKIILDLARGYDPWRASGRLEPVAEMLKWFICRGGAFSGGSWSPNNLTPFQKKRGSLKNGANNLLVEIKKAWSRNSWHLYNVCKSLTASTNEFRCLTGVQVVRTKWKSFFRSPFPVYSRSGSFFRLLVDFMSKCIMLNVFLTLQFCMFMVLYVYEIVLEIVLTSLWELVLYKAVVYREKEGMGVENKSRPYLVKNPRPCYWRIGVY